MKTVVDLVTSLKTFFLGKDTLIESSIAPVEANPADSSRAYTIGKKLYIENVLYRVTAQIAIHDALVEGTNIEVADDITTQLDSIPDMTGATSLADGAHGFVPAPQAGDEAKVLKGDGTWGDAASSISTLKDVNLTTLANKDVLRYNSTSQKWENDQLNDKADKTDLTSIIATGATNTTGAPITNGTYFYKDGVMSRAIADIAENATFTLNTNYENVPKGAVNDLRDRNRYSGSITFLGQIFAYSNAYEMIIPLPMDTSEYTSITCNEYRPSGQTSIIDTNPSITLYANQVLLKSSVSGFSGYVGKEGICRLSFT